MQGQEQLQRHELFCHDPGGQIRGGGLGLALALFPGSCREVRGWTTLPSSSFTARGIMPSLSEPACGRRLLASGAWMTQGDGCPKSVVALRSTLLCMRALRRPAFGCVVSSCTSFGRRRCFHCYAASACRASSPSCSTPCCSVSAPFESVCAFN